MPEGLLAPRLYRAAFAPALLALIIMAFSLQQPPRPLAPELSPPGFSPARAVVFADQAVSNYGTRTAGSSNDQQLADLVEARLQAVGFTVMRRSFKAATLDGRRRLVNLAAVRPGPSDRRLLVIASRDGAAGELARSGALETGVLLELARVLEGRAFNHTLVLASVSGGVDGGLGADRLAAELRGPFDAVIVLRNLGGAPASAAILSSDDTRTAADPRMVGTLERIASREYATSGGDSGSVAGQVARLALPVALGEQATLSSHGLSGAAISPAGEPLSPSAGDQARAAAMAGQTALRALTTFDGSFRPAPPEAAPIQIRGKEIPQWALVLLIGALLFPLVVVSVDAWARARRWRYVSQRGVLAPALAFGWLLVIGFLLRAAGVSGVVHAPALAPDPAAVSGPAPELVGIVALVFALVGVLVASGAARQATPRGGEAGFALWIVFSGLALFIVNPITAGVLLPLLHLVTLMLLTGAARRRKVAALTALGLLPLVAAGAYLASVLGLAPGAILGYAVLLEAGGFISPIALVVICAAFAAFATALIHLYWTAPRSAATGRRSGVSASF